MKSLKKNYVYNLIYQIMAIISPLITAPYIARVLGAENIGKYSYTQSIVSYIVLLTTLGTTMYAQREIAFHQGDKKKQSKIFFELLSIRVLFGLAGSIVMIGFIFFYEQYRVLFMIQSFEIFANMICIDWFYAGNEEFKTTMIRNFIVRIINIAGIFLFVRKRSDFTIYVAMIVFSTLFSNASLWIRVKSFLTRVPLKSLSFRKHIVGSASVFAAQISASIYSMLDKTMIGVITNSDLENGYYEQAQKIEKIALTFVTAFGTVIMPRISKAHSGEDVDSLEKSIYTSFNYMWFLALPMTLGLISTTPIFIPWFYGDGYEKSIILIQILALLLVAIGINNIIGVQYLFVTKKEKILTMTELVGALVNVTLNLILIGRIASIGAAIASVAAESVIAIVQLLYVRKELNVKKMLILSWKYLIASLIMFIGLEMLKFLTIKEASFMNIIILVTAGVTIYFVMLLILKETFFLQGVKRFLFKKSGMDMHHRKG